MDADAGTPGAFVTKLHVSVITRERSEMLKELIQEMRRGISARGARISGECPSRSETLILFFNTMWGQPIDTDGPPLPDGCHLTTDRRQLERAAAVVFHVPSLRELQPRKPRGQLWVAWSMECEANYPQLRDPGYMSRFDLSMTYRLNADVPIAYTSYYSDAANLERALRARPGPKTADKLATLFISSGLNQSGRVEYAAELMLYLDVHSYGKVLRNRGIPPPDRDRPTKLEIIAGYKFDLSFENAVAEDYVTEKFFDPLVAGSVPVYLGAPNIETFAPGDHCFISTAGFRGPRELADYLLHLHHDDAAYEAYFAWKERPFRPAFRALLAGQEAHSLTRLCRAVQARRGGQP